MSDLLPSTTGPVTTTVPNALSSRPNIWTLLKALRRRWLLASFAGVLCAAVAASATWFLLPQKYTALTLVQVPQDYGYVVDIRVPRTDLLNHQKNQVSLVKSRLVLNTALKNSKVADLNVVREQTDALEWLEKQLLADFMIAGEILRISITGDKPQELVTMVDAVRDAYLKEFFEKEQLEKTERLGTLRQMRETYEMLLRGRKGELTELRKQGTSKNATRQELAIRSTEQELTWAERDLGKAIQDIRQATVELSALQAKEKKLASTEMADSLFEEGLRNNRAAQSLLAEVEKLQTRIETTKELYTLRERHPYVQELVLQLKAKRKELAVLSKEALRADVRRDIVTLETRLSVYQDQRALLEKDAQRLRQRLETVIRQVDKVEATVEDISVQDNILKSITSEEEKLRLEMSAPRRVRVLDEGYAKAASGLTRPMTAAMAGMSGLGLVLLAVSWWEFRARRIESVDEVIQGLGLKLVGSIPDLSHRWFGPRRKQDEHSQHLFVESIDTTRTMLLEGARAESAHRGEDMQWVPQVVMITSAQGGEGKTSLATHLAASLAQIGHKTLLIDADLRNPTAHRIIGLSCEPGCCELLRGEVELAEVIRATPIDGLFMITGGHWDNRATRALAKPRTGSLIQQLRSEYEFILIDSSPVLPVVDPLLLSRHVDIVLLSVLCNVSRMKNVHTACQRLTTVGVRSLRAVMSGVRGEVYDSSYQYFSHADTNL